MVSLLDRSVGVTEGATPRHQPSQATGSFYRELSSSLARTSDDMRVKSESIYINSFLTESRQGANKIYQTNSDNPDQLSKELTKHKEGLLSNIPAALAPRLSAEYDSMGESYLNKATNLADEKLNSQRRIELEQNEFVTVRDSIGIADDLFKNNKNLSPDQIKAKALIATNAFAIGNEALLANWGTVGSDGKKLLTDQQILAKDTKFKQALFSRAAESYLQAAPNKLKAYDDWVNNRVSIETPEGNINIRDSMSPDIKDHVDSKLRAAFKEDLSIKKQYLDEKKARADTAVSDRIFSNMLSGNFLADPSNKADKGIVDANYNRLAETSDNPIELGKAVAVKTGIIPSEFKRYINANLLNGDSTQRVQAAESMLELLKEKPILEGQFSKKEIAFAVELNSRVGAGVPLDKAVEYSENNITANKSQDRLLREGKFNLEYGDLNKSKKGIKLVDELASNLTDKSGIFFEAKAPDRMGIELARTAKDFYLNEGMELDKAFEAAKMKVSGEWGVTEVGNRRFQKYAPEKYYSVPNYNDKWIENQALSEVRKNMIEDISDKQLAKQVTLEPIPDSLTGKPSYHIYREDEFGAKHIILDRNNNFIKYTPDFTKTKEFKKAEEERKSLMLSPESEDVFRERQKKILENRVKEGRFEAEMSSYKSSIF